MRAGRDLDLVVIDKVMGWHYDPARTFSPSTNVFHAWEMEEYLVSAPELNGAYGEALLQIVLGGALDESGPAALALAHASPHQRCLAALKAVGVEATASEAA